MNPWAVIELRPDRFGLMHNDGSDSAPEWKLQIDAMPKGYAREMASELNAKANSEKPHLPTPPAS